MDDLKTLFSLTGAYGPSGSEAEGVADVVEELFRSLTAEVWRDPLGDVYAKMGSGRPVVLVAAHMDEIHMRVNRIEENGMLRLANGGGIDVKVLPGSEVLIHGARPVPAVIGAVPPHLLQPKDQDNAYPMEELLADTGLTPDHVRELIRVGDGVTFAPAEPTLLANDLVVSKTMDDRSLVYCMLLCMEQLKKRALPCTVIFCATVQEERGCFGGAAAGYHADPDLAIAMDVCHAPTPDAPAERTIPLDKVGVTMGGNVHPGVYGMLKAAAERCHLSLETIVTMGATGTDARTIQLQREGIPTAVLELPLKYMHTPVELGSLRTLHDCAQLLTETVCAIDEGWEERLCWND